MNPGFTSAAPRARAAGRSASLSVPTIGSRAGAVNSAMESIADPGA